MGIEPTSLQSQYNILPIKLFPLIQAGLEPASLHSQYNVLPIKLQNHKQYLSSIGIEPITYDLEGRHSTY